MMYRHLRFELNSESKSTYTGDALNAPQCNDRAVMKFGGGWYEQAANGREQLRSAEDRLCTKVLCKYPAYYLGKDVAPVK